LFIVKGTRLMITLPFCIREEILES